MRLGFQYGLIGVLVLSGFVEESRPIDILKPLGLVSAILPGKPNHERDFPFIIYHVLIPPLVAEGPKVDVALPKLPVEELNLLKPFNGSGKSGTLNRKTKPKKCPAKFITRVYKLKYRNTKNGTFEYFIVNRKFYLQSVTIIQWYRTKKGKIRYIRRRVYRLPESSNYKMSPKRNSAGGSRARNYFKPASRRRKTRAKPTTKWYRSSQDDEQSRKEDEAEDACDILEEAVVRESEFKQKFPRSYKYSLKYNSWIKKNGGRMDDGRGGEIDDKYDFDPILISPDNDSADDKEDKTEESDDEPNEKNIPKFENLEYRTVEEYYSEFEDDDSAYSENVTNTRETGQTNIYNSTPETQETDRYAESVPDDVKKEEETASTTIGKSKDSGTVLNDKIQKMNITTTTDEYRNAKSVPDERKKGENTSTTNSINKDSVPSEEHRKKKTTTTIIYENTESQSVRKGEKQTDKTTKTRKSDVRDTQTATVEKRQKKTTSATETKGDVHDSAPNAEGNKTVITNASGDNIYSDTTKENVNVEANISTKQEGRNYVKNENVFDDGSEVREPMKPNSQTKSQDASGEQLQGERNQKQINADGTKPTTNNKRGHTTTIKETVIREELPITNVKNLTDVSTQRTQLWENYTTIDKSNDTPSKSQYHEEPEMLNNDEVAGKDILRTERPSQTSENNNLKEQPTKPKSQDSNVALRTGTGTNKPHHPYTDKEKKHEISPTSEVMETTTVKTITVQGNKKLENTNKQLSELENTANVTGITEDEKNKVVVSNSRNPQNTRQPSVTSNIVSGTIERKSPNTNSRNERNPSSRTFEVNKINTATKTTNRNKENKTRKKGPETNKQGVKNWQGAPDKTQAARNTKPANKPNKQTTKMIRTEQSKDGTAKVTKVTKFENNKKVVNNSKNPHNTKVNSEHFNDTSETKRKVCKIISLRKSKQHRPGFRKH